MVPQKREVTGVDGGGIGVDGGGIGGARCDEKAFASALDAANFGRKAATVANALDRLWSLHLIGLPVRPLNAIISLYVAAPPRKPTHSH